MFEDDIDGNPIPCEHPLRWFHRLAAWAHERIEDMAFLDRQKWHDRLPDWVCEAHERVAFDYPCRQCEADRSREYGATTADDAAVTERFRMRSDEFKRLMFNEWPPATDDLDA